MKFINECCNFSPAYLTTHTLSLLFSFNIKQFSISINNINQMIALISHAFSRLNGMYWNPNIHLRYAVWPTHAIVYFFVNVYSRICVAFEHRNNMCIACQLRNSYFSAVEENAQNKIQTKWTRKTTKKKNNQNKTNRIETMRIYKLSLWACFPKCERYFIIISKFSNRETTTTTINK